MARIDASCREAVIAALAPVLEIPESEGANFLIAFDALTQKENPFPYLIRYINRHIKVLPLYRDERINLENQIIIISSLGEILP